MSPAYDPTRYPVTAVDLARQRSSGRRRRGEGHQPRLRPATTWIGASRTRANTFVDDRPGTDAPADYAALQDLDRRAA